MEIRRTSQREVRRRRVLVDEAAAAPSRDERRTSQRAGAQRAPVRSYTEAALAEHQARVTDLLPRRAWSLLAVFLFGLTLIVGLEALHTCSRVWEKWLAPGDLAALELTAPGSLATWFSSLLLTAAAVLSVLVFTLRRHKIDDYRGRYSIWMWAALAWLFASIDATAGMHHALRASLTGLTGLTLVRDGTIWWIGLYVVGYGSLGIRLLVDMRACRLSSTALLAAAGCYLVGALGQLDYLRVEPKLVGAMLHVGAVLMGHYLLAISMLLHARHVHLDAQGQLKQRNRRQTRRTRSRNQAAQQDRDADAETVAIHLDRDNDKGKEQKKEKKKENVPVKSRPTVKIRSAPDQSHSATKGRRGDTVSSEDIPPEELTGGSGASASDFAHADDDDGEEQKLSKAERRKLRKQKRRRQAA